MVTKKLELAFIRCRSFSHEWHWEKPLGIDDSHPTISKPFGMSTAMIGFPAVCQSCGQEKVKWITRSGETITKRHYPEGYQQHGDDVQSPQEYRSEYVESVFAAFEQNVTSIRKQRAS